MGTKVRLALKTLSTLDYERPRPAYFIKATIGRISALLTREISFVKIGTAAFKSLNRKSISITTFCDSLLLHPPSLSITSDGAVSGGFASLFWPGIRSATDDREVVAVDITSAISPSIKSRESSLTSRGNLMSRTASTLPDVSHEKGPSSIVVACRWSMLTPSIRNRD